MVAADSWVQVGVVMFILILFTLFYEIIVEQIYKLFIRYHIPPLFLGAIFKELTKLGLISFLLIILQTLSIGNTDVIESLHRALFIVSIIYIAMIALLLTQSVIWSNYVKFLEYSIEESKKKSVEIARKIADRYISFTDYHAIRRDFINFNKLDEHFPFYKYVRLTTQETILEIIELDAKIWLTLEIIVVSCFLFDFLLGRFEILDVEYISIVAEWTLGIISVVMIKKMRDIVKKLSQYHTPEVAPLYSGQKRSIIQQARKTFCPCTLPPSSYISELFWLNSKGLFKRMIQCILLYQSLCIAIIIVSSPEFFKTSWIYAIIIYSLSIIPLIWILFFALPFLVPIYSMVSYTSQYSSRHLINSVLQRKSKKDTSDGIKFGRLVNEEEDEEEVEMNDLADLYIPPNLSNRSSLEKPLLFSTDDA